MTMLDTLRRIVQEVNEAEGLEQALGIIVRRVRQALDIDVCSVYLVIPGMEILTLRATEGLNPESVGRVRLKFTEGLTGLVAERAEPVNLDNAPDHPRYKYFPETGEERYHAFLGVPIIQQRRLLGVIVVQQHERRRFEGEHVAFLVTLAAQLAGAITHAELIGEVGALATPDHEIVQIHGIPGSPGIAIGTGIVAWMRADPDAVPDRAIEDVEEEVQFFIRAIEGVKEDIRALRESMNTVLPAEELALFDAYLLILNGDSLIAGTTTRIRKGNWAAGALRDTIRELGRAFGEMDDPYLRERAADLKDIARRILLRLRSAKREEISWPERTILVGEDITASQLAEVPPNLLAGVISARGTGSSHVAILARAMGIPAVMGVADLPVGRLENREIVVDGYRGIMFLEPGPELRAEFQRLVEEDREMADSLREQALEPAITPDGIQIPVYANGGLLADIRPSLESGADGVGLYRTEVPFMVREQFPGEDEQTAIYRQVLESFHPRPVILRTLDVGGDKPLPYFPIREDNPFLGWRGIRITLDHPEIFLTQLRAMLRASEGFGNLSILFPMISAPGELKEALRFVQRAREELLDDGLDIPQPKTGVMIEVPSAIWLAESLARRVDFLSIGTNDLVQYLLAVDRNNSRVADLYQALHPAVLHALRQIVEGSHRAGKPVSVCGEMASDPAAVILLMGMEIDSLSVSAGAISRIKWVVRHFSRTRAADLLRQALGLDDPAAIRGLLNNALEQAGLGGLVRAGKR